MAFVPSSGSVAAWLQSNNASVITVGAANQSVSGTVVNITQGSVATVIIGGSIAASFTPPANQSVSGAVSISNFPTTQNVSGSVAAFLAGSTNASVITVGTAVANQSVSGTVLIGNTVTINSPSVYGNISGSVVSFQGTNQWLETFSNSSILAVPVGSVITVVQSSVAVVIIGGSILTSSTENQSVSGTVQISGNPSISGTVLATQNTTPWVISSVYGNVSGSVVAFQGTSPWVVNFQNSSIIALQSGSVVSINQGSVATVQIGQAGTVITSIAGSYASNSASVVSGLGVLGLGIRNDTLSSVLATADGRYSPVTIGPWGEQVVSNAPGNKWVSGVASVFTGVPQPVITSVLGAFINVTGVQIANASANNVYISFSGAGLGSVVGSIIGYTVAPANGGSNIYFANAIKTGVNNPFQASVSGVASIFVSAQGFYSNT